MASESSEKELMHIVKTHFKSSPSPQTEAEVAEKIRNFEVRDDDTFLIGYPKSGTTWATEMIWLIANDLDVEGAQKFIDERFPVLEACGLDTKSFNPDIDVPVYHSDSITFTKNLKSPRFIKTHSKGTALPEQIQNGSKKPKIVYVARNVKDACVSFYYYLKDVLQMFDGSLDDFSKVFMAGFGDNSYWEHVMYFWERRNEPNILFIWYEDMKKDLPAVIRRATTFFNKSLTDEQMTTLLKMLDFEYMKTNPAVNHDELYKKSGFIRSGKVGGYKKDMSPHIIKHFDILIEKHFASAGFEM